MSVERIHAFFNHAGFRKAWVKSRVLIGLVLAGMVLWQMDPRWLLPGFLVSMAGELIQLWCFASLNKSVDLACNGPYAVVRNPMYLGRFFIILGAVMLLGNWWLILAYVVIYYFYMVNRVKREEAKLRPILGAPYAQYCAAVHPFLPGQPYRGSTLVYWDWKLLRQNHGGANLAATLVFWIAAAVIAWWP
jgi:protein-S-isoprenylcysteine O-methyltransferase Ste14